MLRKLDTVLIGLVMIFFIGCTYPTANRYEEERLEEETIEKITESSQLFSKEGSTGAAAEYVFSTNDRAYVSENGHTLWTEISEGRGKFRTIETTAVKSSGNINAGYGIVFCIDNIEEAEMVHKYMYVLLVNCKGLYAIGQVKDGTYTPMIGWSESKNLLSGIGVKNKIRIEKEEGVFIISFNDSVEEYFSPSQKPELDTSGHGYAVVISPNEDFPGKEVKVTFTGTKETDNE